MFCNKCSCQIDDGAVACPLCGTRLEESSIPSYLVLAVVSTVCCCLPTGIVAIVYAYQVNAKLAHGDVTGAQESSRKARRWIVVSIVLSALYVICMLCASILCKIAKMNLTDM